MNIISLLILVQKLFELPLDTGGLSDKTVLHYHKLISTILEQATRDRLIPFNIADRNHMKAPKLERKEAAFLDDEQVRHVLELLENEPIKWKTIMYALRFTNEAMKEEKGSTVDEADFPDGNEDEQEEESLGLSIG